MNIFTKQLFIQNVVLNSRTDRSYRYIRRMDSSYSYIKKTDKNYMCIRRTVSSYRCIRTDRSYR